MYENICMYVEIRANLCTYIPGETACKALSTTKSTWDSRKSEKDFIMEGLKYMYVCIMYECIYLCTV